MTVAIYARVSTEEQTLEQQIEPCIKRCEAEGWEYIIFKEKASGKRDSRPELDLMMQQIRARKIKSVMVYKLDRLGRSLKHLLQLIEEFRNKGVPFISLTEGFDTNTPMGRFAVSIVGAMAQMERELISERTKVKLAHLKSQGKHLGRPFGAKDKKPRRKSGYYTRWAGGRAKNKWGKK